MIREAGLIPRIRNMAGDGMEAQATSAQSAEQSEAAGVINRVNGPRISGWAADPRNGERPTIVEFFVDDKRIHSVEPDRSREDIAARGFGRNRGFFTVLPLEAGTYT